MMWAGEVIKPCDIKLSHGNDRSNVNEKEEENDVLPAGRCVDKENVRGKG